LKKPRSGLKVMTIDEAAAEADVIMILLPTPSRRRSTTPRSHRT